MHVTLLNSYDKIRFEKKIDFCVKKVFSSEDYIANQFIQDDYNSFENYSSYFFKYWDY